MQSGLVVLFMLFAACRPPTACGEGTLEVQGVCVIDLPARDAGHQSRPDAGGPLDAGGETPDELFASIRLVTSAPTGANGERLMPVGLPITFAVWGRFIDGSSQPLRARPTFVLRPDDGTATLRAHDGVLEITANRPASLQLTVELETVEGFTLSDSVRLKALPVDGEVVLRAFTAQDGPWYEPATAFISTSVHNAFNAFDSSGGPPLGAVAPVGGGVRVLTAAMVALEGRVARFHLDPARLTYGPSPGLTASQDGLIGSAVAAEGIVTVSLAGAKSTTVLVSFVPESPLSALRLAGEGPVVRNSEMPTESTSVEGSVTLASITEAPAQLAALGFASTRAGRSTRAWVLGRHAGYFEWLSLSAVARTVIERPEAYRATGDGRVTATSPGVGLEILSHGGLSLPVVIRTPYPFGTILSLRAEPTSTPRTIAAVGFAQHPFLNWRHKPTSHNMRYVN